MSSPFPQGVLGRIAFFEEQKIMKSHGCVALRIMWTYELLVMIYGLLILERLEILVLQRAFVAVL
jgi:hypothetical protein